MRCRILAAIVPLLVACTLAVPCAVRAADEVKPSESKPAADAPAAASEKRSRPRIAAAERTAWMFGLGTGYGWGSPTFDDLEPDMEAGGTFYARVGYAAGPTSIAGVEYVSWSATADTNTWKVTAVGPSVTWYFTEQGYLRAMAGIGMMDVAYDQVDPAQSGSPVVHYTAQDDGFAYYLAAGYEWRYGRRVGISPEIQYLNVSAGQGTNASTFNAALQLNFYY